MRLISLWIGKTVFTLLRLSGKRGSALPGLIVEWLYPKFLAGTLAKIPEGVIVITGTNGKTTSTKMLSYIIRQNKRVLTNPTGSNFIRGIIASLLQHSNWTGSLPYDVVVIELDEAYAAKFVEHFKPRGTIVLNVMRDQMDRFGEIDYTAGLINKVVINTTDFVVLNRDDPRVLAMADNASCPVYLFGVSDNLRNLFKNDDELHDDASEKKSGKKASVELLNIEKNNLLTIDAGGQKVNIKLEAKGTFNAQNSLAVIAAGLAMDYTVEDVTARLVRVKAAFGRGEQIRIGSKNIILQLVKNPSGFRHALLSGSQYNHVCTTVAINDNYADGRDVSWLWDVIFNNTGGIKGVTFTCGTRAADMALRFKYDDIKTDYVEPNLNNCLDKAIINTPDNKTMVIYTTYTAMLELRKLLSLKSNIEKI
jgi:UDP-N-acetylmuramyl tripeptide synthase